ncbi:uncharacterized protein LOC126687898 [Mercurialis annua]|uniref:uncharacterized protein LOC126687898 n=1 Tax=Mercurialis annua TaxID=3986 RepID=UPI00215F8E4A|nr:uncharacterized protein LOC126687898 [Mercurialis annua]
MKFHPAQKKRDLTLSDQNAVVCSTANPKPKKLKRLPHVFCKVLELPFNSDADVFVEETQDSLLFIVSSAGADEDTTTAHDFQVHVTKILPGVTKITVLRAADGGEYDSLQEDHDINTWRFRLPARTLPEMASVVCIGGKLVVTVPKALSVEDTVKEDNFSLNDNDAMGSLFLVDS